MMPHISEKDKELMKECEEKWMYFGEDGYFHLKEDAPKYIKEHYERVRKAYRMV